MRVLFYAHHNLGAWWRYAAAQLSGASYTVILSDSQADADVWLMPRFYQAWRTSAPDKLALATFGESGCAEIIARCRLLRSLKRALALRMVGAMWRAVDSVVEEQAPDLVLSLPVDHYVLDLLERAARRRGIRYLGFWDAILPGLMIVTTRGQYMPVREPSAAEVNEAVTALVNPSYLPPYLLRPSRYHALSFARPQLALGARGWVFELLRRWRRDPLSFRYLATWAHVAEYRLSFRDWAVTRHLDARWRDKLAAVPFERRVFVGLQYNPEATIDYAVEATELIDYRKVLERLVARLTGAGYAVFVKDHPAMFGLRQYDVFQRLARFPGVTFIPYEVSAREMLDACKTAFTWTGTIGFEAAMAGRCAIVAQGTYYAQPDLFLVVSSLQDLDALPDRIARFAPPADLQPLRRRLVEHVLRGCVPGSAQLAENFRRQRPGREERAAATIRSLNELVPRLAAAPRAADPAPRVPV